MLIRCPKCEFTRNINESKIPSTAELATCPKCGERFRFRSIERPKNPFLAEPEMPSVPGPSSHSATVPSPTVVHPQSAVAESSSRHDIWDAVDDLNSRWHAQAALHDTRKRVSSPEATPHYERKAPQTPGPLNVFYRGQLENTGVPVTHESDHFPQENATLPLSPPSTLPPHSLRESNDPVERRVDDDLRMLQENGAPRPLRDLGALQEPFEDTYDETAHAASQAMIDVPASDHANGVPSPEEPSHIRSSFPPGDEEESNGSLLDADPTRTIPWERPAHLGWLKAFFDTLRGVMFRGPSFFSYMEPSGSLAPGYLFFLLLGYWGIFCTVAWTKATALLLPGVLPERGGSMLIPALLILAPIALGLVLLFIVSAIRLTLRLLSPEKADFDRIYLVTSYSAAPFILSTVPFAGPLIGASWFAVNVTIGCRYSLKLPWILSVIAAFIPTALLVGGIGWYLYG